MMYLWCSQPYSITSIHCFDHFFNELAHSIIIPMRIGVSTGNRLSRKRHIPSFEKGGDYLKTVSNSRRIFFVFWIHLTQNRLEWNYLFNFFYVFISHYRHSIPCGTHGQGGSPCSPLHFFRDKGKIIWGRIQIPLILSKVLTNSFF